MWINGISSSSSRIKHWRKLLSAAATAVGILISATAPLFSQTQPVVDYHVRLKFNGTFDGAQPIGNLILDSKGAVYGVTNFGGVSYGECVPGYSGCGVFYKWDHGRFTTVSDFTDQDPSVFAPSSGLIRDAQGNFYGETNGRYCPGSLGIQCPGMAYYGTVYKLDTQGKITVLHLFTKQEFWPMGGLIQDAAGNLYGTSYGYCNSGGDGCGEVFKIDPTGLETVLYSFPAGGKVGSNPTSGLVQDAEGNLYGTTAYGGTGTTGYIGVSGAGVLFKLTPSGQMTVLHNFNGTSDGAFPSNLVRDQQGNLFGYTSVGGNLAACPNEGGCGVVYKYNTNGEFSVVHTFSLTDGQSPVGTPLLIGNSIYGVAAGGDVVSGGCPCGVVFKLDLKDGTETILHAFTNADGDGGGPSSGLVRDEAGNFWGATQWGGQDALFLESCDDLRGLGCGTLYTFALTNP